MNPIPTTNAMKPAPGKGVSSFPTPVIKDTVIVEVVNAWKGDYQPLEYGTKWDDVPHASVQGSFPDHKLINQSPNSEDGQWVKRIWANDRVDQDTYNYAIKYSGGSDAHPIYIRTYVELRETYAPVPDLSPDPLFPNALLVEEEVQRQEDELDSRYVKVIRTYETLPGPIISSRRVNERGDLETVEVQEVAPNTPPDPDGLFVTQTQVIKEDVSKGTKTTATVPSYTQLLVKEKKEGLLGETVTTDDIVDPTTQPDALSQSVVASVVQQTSATKAVKRTTTSSGPTVLTKRSKDGKLLGDVTATQSIVPPNSGADEPNNVILSSEVNQIDSGKAVKTTTVLNSTPTLTSRDKKAGLLGETTATESVVLAGTQPDNLSQTIVSSTVESIDSIRSRKVTVESTGPTQLAGQRVNQRGDLETVVESIVPTGTRPQDDSLLLVSSEVSPIDSAKSKLTTATVGLHSQLSGAEQKSGLYGVTQTIDSIVPAGSPPDELSLNGIIESTVTPISKTKSRKVTVFSGGPNKLDSNSLVDSPIGLVKAKVEKSMVSPSTQPQYDEQQGLTILRDNIEPLDESKSQREVIDVSDWPENTGVDYDDELGIGVYYKETIVNPSEYINSNYWEDLSNINYKPIDQWKSLKRSIDKEKLKESLLSQWYKISTGVQITLPDKLLEIKSYFGSSFSEAEDYDFGAGAFTGSYERNQSGSTKSSASMSGEVYFRIQKGFSGSIPGYKHIFFLEIPSDGRIAGQSIINKLNELEQFGTSGPTIPGGGEGVITLDPKYKPWPYIKSISENILLISGGKSETINKSLSESVSINGASRSEGAGKSLDVNVSVNSITVPQTLHGVLQTGPPQIIGQVSSKQELQVDYSVQPEQLSATDPERFPAGNYLYDSNVEIYKWGFVKVTAITVEITDEYT